MVKGWMNYIDESCYGINSEKVIFYFSSAIPFMVWLRSIYFWYLIPHIYYSEYNERVDGFITRYANI